MICKTLDYLYELAKICGGRTDADAVRCSEIFRSLCRDLPELSLWKMASHVAEGWMDILVCPFAFDEADRLAVLRDHEIHLASLHIPEIAKLQIAAFGIALEINPLF